LKSNFHSLLISLLVVFLIIIIILYWFFAIKERVSPFIFARAIATYYLNQFKSLPQFANLKISRSYPVYASLEAEITCYDIKLIDEEGNDQGYILVNLDRKESPILEFTSEGLSLTEQLRKKVGKEKFKVLWLSPTYTVALNSDGDIISSIGDYMLDEAIIETFKEKKSLHENTLS